MQDVFCVVPFATPEYVHWAPLFTGLASASQHLPNGLLRALGDATAALASAAKLRPGSSGALQSLFEA